MRGAIRYAIIAGVVLVVLIIGIILAAIFGVLLDVLYIFLMILAALMVTGTLLQIYSVIMLIRTITTVRDEMKPLLASVQDTVGIFKDTAQTASHTVSTIGSTAQLASEFGVGPGVRAAAAVVAGGRVVSVFLGRGKPGTRADKRRKEQMEALRAAEAQAVGGE